MSDQIGIAAGKVWEFLTTKGMSTASQIQKGTGMDAVAANQAIGWLARENKLIIDRSKRYATYALRD